ncbi:hypothetical protein D8B26_008422 [Coccidioides posadasii str. Silveira]|uniref:uncharacterized protein n=1 Tax=Coccidioides posadasii (strain RMSCC 757 / Silveira) TaxID=443226 RepID=UPI001BEDEB46|nr:hypothetical protein D8B26_008422 [Coccidioides posadasii str. Silveira]
MHSQAGRQTSCLRQHCARNKGQTPPTPGPSRSWGAGSAETRERERERAEKKSTTHLNCAKQGRALFGRVLVLRSSEDQSRDCQSPFVRFFGARPTAGYVLAKTLGVFSSLTLAGPTIFFPLAHPRAPCLTHSLVLVSCLRLFASLSFSTPCHLLFYFVNFFFFPFLFLILNVSWIVYFYFEFST